MAKSKKTVASKKNKPEELVETNDNSTDPKTENVSEDAQENGDVESQKIKGHSKKPESESDREEESSKENGEEVEAKEDKKKPTPKKTISAKKTPSKTISEPERKSSRTPKPVKSEEEESHEKYKEDNKKKSPTKRASTKTSSKSPAKKAKKEDKDYEVEAIVGMRTKNGKQEYKIRWKGYKPSDDTWEPEKHLSCQDLIDQYLEEHKDEVEEKEKKPTKKDNTPAKPATTKSGRRAKTKH